MFTRPGKVINRRLEPPADVTWYSGPVGKSQGENMNGGTRMSQLTTTATASVSASRRSVSVPSQPARCMCRVLSPDFNFVYGFYFALHPVLCLCRLRGG